MMVNRVLLQRCYQYIDFRKMAFNIQNYFIKDHSHFVYPGFCSTEKDKIQSGQTLRAVCPKLSMICLLMSWRLKGPGN